ncbi:MAG: hypothetical protein JO250_17700, partial [Armatimonadetes bacterium]|nr:hypothetical protein [Armatimonadota bacterium]
MDENTWADNQEDDEYVATEPEDEEEFDPHSIRWDNGIVLFIGRLPQESATTAAKTTGRDYITKLLRSSAANWNTINELIQETGSNPRTQIVCTLTEDDLFNACLPDYKEAFQKILVSLEGTRHLVLVYYKILQQEFNWLSPYAVTRITISNNYTQDHVKAVEALRSLVARLNSGRLRVLPYRKRIELNSSMAAFLTEEFTGLVFRLYVPNDRLWGDELDKLLTLFRDYLVRVVGVQVALNQNRTEHGISYSFYSRDSNLVGDNFATALQGFNSFLDVCAQDPMKASDILRAANVPEANVRDIVTRYSRDSRRLMLDIEYARKSAMDQIQYRLMSELIDLESQEQSRLLSGKIAEKSLPT